MNRHYLDGKPYYCAVCGAGYGEYEICEERICKLESEEEAIKRMKKKRYNTKNLKPYKKYKRGAGFSFGSDPTDTE